MERNVPQAELSNGVVTLRDRRRRQVEADECALGIDQTERDDVAALAATQFEHAAAIDRCWSHADKSGDCRQMFRMRLPQGMARISDGIISEIGFRHEAAPGIALRI
jgi:hypothetical protein